MDENLINFSFDEEKDKIKIVSVQEEGFEAIQYDCPKCNSSFCSLNIDDISTHILKAIYDAIKGSKSGAKAAEMIEADYPLD